jgi:ABC-type nitrate/sulfonate/bicarbonate transport system permease component
VTTAHDSSFIEARDLHMAFAGRAALDSLNLAATFAVIGVVVAEFYSSDEGLGYLLLLQVSNGSTTHAFGSILYLTILGLIIFGAVVALERALVPAHMLKRFEDAAARQVG